MKEINCCEQKVEPIKDQNVVDISLSLDDNDRITLIMMFDKNHIDKLDDLLEWLKDLDIQKFAEP